MGRSDEDGVRGALRAADETGIPTLLDSYGATNPAEFLPWPRKLFRTTGLALRQRSAPQLCMPSSSVSIGRIRRFIPASRLRNPARPR